MKDKVETLHIKELIPEESLINMNNVFAEIFQVGLQLLDPDNQPITKISHFPSFCRLMNSKEQGQKFCQESISRLLKEQLYIEGIQKVKCHCHGFLKIIQPIRIKGRHLATWIMIIKEKAHPDPQTIQEMAQKLDIDDKTIIKAYNESAFISQEEQQKAIHMLAFFTEKVAEYSWNNFKLKQEIIKRQQAEQEKSKSERLFRLLAENTKDIICLHDAQAKYLYVSPSVTAVLGYTAQELIGSNPYTLVHPDDIDDILKKGQEAFNRGEDPPPIIYRIRKKDGSYTWFESTNRAIKDKDGKNTQSVSISRDITQRLNTERALQNTQRLESLALLAGGIAHDFNNLLAGIYGYIFLAESQSTEEEVSRYLQKSLQTINRARGLTTQLLTFAKGGEPVKKVDHIFPFIKETAEFALSGSNVNCQFSVSPDLLPASFDPNQMAQVIDNIIINAQQAMPLGGEIKINLENHQIQEGADSSLKAGEYVKITIKDSGIGIPAEMVHKIFDPFFTTKSKGQGLGLASSYSIIKKHEGTIEVDSEPGKGSRFYLYLPAVRQKIKPKKKNSEETLPGKGTILYMDDEAFMREIMKDLLSSFGFKVICKATGEECLEYFEQLNQNSEKPIACILDLTVPGAMDGRETAAEIKKINAEIPLFVTSGYSENPVMANPEKFGFAGSLEKPFQGQDIKQLLLGLTKK